MRGRPIPLSRPRRLVGDLLYFAAGVPTAPVQRRMNLQPLIDSLAFHPERPSWTAIFTKAYAIVANEFPDVRRAYLKLPWPQLYEYPASIASVAFDRDFDGEKAVLIGRVKDPATTALSDLDQKFKVFLEAPLAEMKDFRRALRMCRLPRLVRRWVWWLLLNYGRRRGSYFGTFAVRPAVGAESLHPSSPLTTLLTYGPVDPDGVVDVRIVYDQRVLDEATIARVLGRLEEVLNSRIADEIRTYGVFPLRLVA
ncbi:MAG TPA: hypothetical protein VKE40_19640 [Gemmataceae bacterium]|nr:hypothetical protein [Gemmataceae bacterium]